MLKSVRLPLALIVFASTTLVGCAQIWPTPRTPNLGVEATGEELWIRTQHHQAQVTERKKVGEAVHKDSRGRNVGKTELYEDQTRTVHWTTWYPMQGDLQIDDEDFLRIVGDGAELERTRDYRRKGLEMNKWGKRGIVAGAVTLAASLFVPRDLYMLQYTATTLGGVALSGGWWLAYAGAKRFEPESHAVDPNKAAYLMHGYNASLGAPQQQPSASLSVGGQF
jgi:hypothetical protein